MMSGGCERVANTRCCPAMDETTFKRDGKLAMVFSLSTIRGGRKEVEYSVKTVDTKVKGSFAEAHRTDVGRPGFESTNEPGVGRGGHAGDRKPIIEIHFEEVCNTMVVRYEVGTKPSSRVE